MFPSGYERVVHGVSSQLRGRNTLCPVSGRKGRLGPFICFWSSLLFASGFGWIGGGRLSGIIIYCVISVNC